MHLFVWLSALAMLLPFQCSAMKRSPDAHFPVAASKKNKTASKALVFSCTKCDVSFDDTNHPFRKNVRRHILFCTREKMFFNASVKRIMVKGTNSIKNSRGRCVFNCSLCNKSFTMTAALTTHSLSDAHLRKYTTGNLFALLQKAETDLTEKSINNAFNAMKEHFYVMSNSSEDGLLE